MHILNNVHRITPRENSVEIRYLSKLRVRVLPLLLLITYFTYYFVRIYQFGYTLQWYDFVVLALVVSIVSVLFVRYIIRPTHIMKTVFDFESRTITIDQDRIPVPKNHKITIIVFQTLRYYELYLRNMSNPTGLQYFFMRLKLDQMEMERLKEKLEEYLKPLNVEFLLKAGEPRYQKV